MGATERMKINSTKAALQRGEVVIGPTISHFNCRGIGKIMAAAGFDFVLIDMQHSSFGSESICDLILQLREADVTPIVRIPIEAKTIMGQAMDAGAQSIMVPDVDKPEIIRETVKTVLYPPLGERSIGGKTVSSDFATDIDIYELRRSSNDQYLGVFQIEGEAAINNLDELLAQPGLDVAEIGPWDLSQSLGIPGDFKNPRFLECVDLVIEKCVEHGKYPGIFAGTLELGRFWIERGMKMLFFSTDVDIFINGSLRALDILRNRK